MKKSINKVKEFHKCFKQPIESSPTLPDTQVIKLRVLLAFEELDEMVQACQAENLVGIFDALVDQLYILFGTAHVFGMADALEAGLEEVHRSNMTKLGPDKKPLYREDGKVIKSELYEPPNLDKVLKTIYSV